MTAPCNGARSRKPARRCSMVASTIGPEGKETFQTLPLLAVSRQRATDDHTARWGSIVRRTIHERRIVELSHCDLEGRGSNRRLQPFGLTLFDDVWLLTACCELRDDFRNFRLGDSRIISQRYHHLPPSDETKPPDPNDTIIRWHRTEWARPISPTEQRNTLRRRHRRHHLTSRGTKPRLGRSYFIPAQSRFHGRQRRATPATSWSSLLLEILADRRCVSNIWER